MKYVLKNGQNFETFILNFTWSGSRYWLRFCYSDRLRPHCTNKVKPHAELYVFNEKLKKGFQTEGLRGVW